MMPEAVFAIDTGDDGRDGFGAFDDLADIPVEIHGDDGDTTDTGGWEIIAEDTMMVDLVTLTDGTTTWRFTDGPCSHSTLSGYNAGVFRVDSFSAELDPKTHESTIGRVSVAMQDAAVRSIVESNRMRGMKLSLSPSPSGPWQLAQWVS